ncbi:MAG: SagB/ThcOx family dehydrogenase [Bacteroidales bacterium]|nr:SagB/ThcOx family dehydrogenase [Bacteroidales bacterium]
MKKSLISLLVLFATLTATAQDIVLPAPQTTLTKKQKGMTLVEALATRHSVRNFSDVSLSEQTISNLCWAAVGVQRDAKHTTNPTARNCQEIRLFVFTPKGAYEYIPEKNLLRFVFNGDLRKLLMSNHEGDEFRQEFVMSAPVSLVLVYDLERMPGDESRTRQMCMVDAGIACQNINLYCQAVGLATVPRATMDVERIREMLQLTHLQYPIMNNPVGYEAK